eukprot:5201521-Prymnesium_polylepis.1
MSGCSGGAARATRAVRDVAAVDCAVRMTLRAAQAREAPHAGLLRPARRPASHARPAPPDRYPTASARQRADRARPQSCRSLREMGSVDFGLFFVGVAIALFGVGLDTQH